MHTHFFHWHTRVSVKPETTILEARWAAAVKASDVSTAAGIVALLKLASSETVDASFDASYTEALMKADPAFPPANNHELLRVMASAALDQVLQKSSTKADAIALGFQSASFLGSRNTLVSADIATDSGKYLATESESMRGEIDITTYDKKPLDGHIANIKKHTEAQTIAEQSKSLEAAFKLLGDSVSTITSEASSAITQLAEESQNLWWVVGKRSPLLSARREDLTDIKYAVVAARELASKSLLLPPALSAEYFLEEALSQCGTRSNAAVGLAEILEGSEGGFSSNTHIGPELTPISYLISATASAGKLTKEAITAVGLSGKPKYLPSDIARQLFRELVFLTALRVVG